MEIIATGRHPAVGGRDLLEAIHQRRTLWPIGVIRRLRIGDLQPQHARHGAGPKQQLQVGHMTVDTRMRQHGDAPRRGHHVHRLIERHLGGARNVCRPTRSHRRVQLVARHARLRGLDRRNDVRLADVATRAGAHGLPRHAIAGGGQPVDRFPFLRLSGLTRLMQAIAQPPVVEREAVAEQMGVDQSAAGFIFNR